MEGDYIVSRLTRPQIQTSLLYMLCGLYAASSRVGVAQVRNG